MYVNKVTRRKETVIWKSEAIKTGFGCNYGPATSKRIRLGAKATGFFCVNTHHNKKYR
jgi:hypothetical protein